MPFSAVANLKLSGRTGGSGTASGLPSPIDAKDAPDREHHHRISDDRLFVGQFRQGPGVQRRGSDDPVFADRRAGAERCPGSGADAVRGARRSGVRSACGPARPPLAGGGTRLSLDDSLGRAALWGGVRIDLRNAGAGPASWLDACDRDPHFPRRLCDRRRAAQCADGADQPRQPGAGARLRLPVALQHRERAGHRHRAHPAGAASGAGATFWRVGFHRDRCRPGLRADHAAVRLGLGRARRERHRIRASGRSHRRSATRPDGVGNGRAGPAHRFRDAVFRSDADVSGNLCR